MNRTIRSGTRKVIYLRCLAESQAGQILYDISDVYKRVSEMTGKSESTIIAQERVKTNGVFSTPGKNRKGRPKIQIDDFDIAAIRQKVHFFYAVKKEVPTLSKLQAVLREDIN